MHLSDPCAKLVLPTKRKEAKMAKLFDKIQLGQCFTTANSKVTGLVQEVVENASGSVRIRLLLPNGKERWTTAK